MYTFADRGEPLGDAAAGGHRGRRPVGDRARPGPRPGCRSSCATPGPFFRYERPQAGRYRQLQQVGVEAIGVDDPALDAEVIAVADEGFRALGLTGYRLEITSLGDAECRPAYRALLQRVPRRAARWTSRPAARAELNPLRVLDDKRPEVRALLADAPLLVDHLSAASAEHHAAVAGAPRRPRRGLRPEPADGARAGLLHEDHVRVRARRSRRAVGHRRRRPLRRADGHPRRAAAVRASASASAWTARCWRAGPRGSRPGRRPAARCSGCRWARRRSGGSWCWPPQLRRGRGAGRPRLRRPRAQGRDEGGRPLRCPVRARAGRARPRGGHGRASRTWCPGSSRPVRAGRRGRPMLAALGLTAVDGRRRPASAGTPGTRSVDADARRCRRTRCAGGRSCCPAGGRALDVACGRGAVAVWLASAGSRWTPWTSPAVGLAAGAALAGGPGSPAAVRLVRARSRRRAARGLRRARTTWWSASGSGIRRCTRALAAALRAGGLLVVTVLSEVGDEPGPVPRRAAASCARRSGPGGAGRTRRATARRRLLARRPVSWRTASRSAVGVRHAPAGRSPGSPPARPAPVVIGTDATSPMLPTSVRTTSVATSWRSRPRRAPRPDSVNSSSSGSEAPA